MVKARDIRGLTCEDPFRSAAGKILWTRFEELMSFRDQVLNPSSQAAAVDAVHDMRVASRRLRASMEVFVDVFPKSSFKTMLRSVKSIADSLGEVRDTDVLAQWLTAARKGKPLSQRQALDEIIAELESNRAGARLRLVSVLDELERQDFPRKFALFVAKQTV